MKNYLPLLLAIPSIATAAPGLIGEYFQLKEALGDEFEIPVGQKPWLVRADKQVNFAEASADFYGSKLADNFMVRWSGSLAVGKGGEHHFYTLSDDGSRLYIDDQLVVDNWGPHSMTKKTGKMALTAGSHSIRVDLPGRRWRRWLHRWVDATRWQGITASGRSPVARRSRSQSDPLGEGRV